MALTLLARKRTTREHRKVEHHQHRRGTCPQRHQVEVQPAQCATPKWHLGEASTEFQARTLHNPWNTSPHR